MQTDIFGVIVGVLGVLVGIAVSYYFYKKSLQLKEPTWGIQSNNLIRNQTSTIPDLKVSFKDEKVSDLTVSRVVFWNNGMETILKKDLETINPLKISAIGDVRLLETKIVMFNNKSNRFLVRETDEKKHSHIEFDYLDYLQGAVIQVVHTGTSSQDIVVEGDIIGVKSLAQINLPPVWDTSQSPRKRLFKVNSQIQNALIVFFLSVILAIIGFAISIPLLSYLYNASNLDISLVIGLIVYFPSLYVAYRIKNLVFPNPTPRGLEGYLTSLQATEKQQNFFIQSD